MVTCGGRVQVKPKGELEGLKVEDPRNIPAIFGAGDLSSAIQCYRTIRPDYELALSVVRHDSAEVLPASIEPGAHDLRGLDEREAADAGRRCG